MRISPNEVHINDPEYFSQLHSFSLKLDKCGWYYNFAASPTAGFSTASYELHRIRRGALAKYFSHEQRCKVGTIDPELRY